MEVFSAVSLQARPASQTLAPVFPPMPTTIAGSSLAIPSVIGYNVLLNKTKCSRPRLKTTPLGWRNRIELEMQK